MQRPCWSAEGSSDEEESIRALEKRLLLVYNFQNLPDVVIADYEAPGSFSPRKSLYQFLKWC